MFAQWIFKNIFLLGGKGMLHQRNLMLMYKWSHSQAVFHWRLWTWSWYSHLLMCITVSFYKCTLPTMLIWWVQESCESFYQCLNRTKLKLVRAESQYTTIGCWWGRTFGECEEGGFFFFCQYCWAVKEQINTSFLILW
jgi:hypothetical protein